MAWKNRSQKTSSNLHLVGPSVGSSVRPPRRIIGGQKISIPPRRILILLGEYRFNRRGELNRIHLKGICLVNMIRFSPPANEMVKEHGALQSIKDTVMLTGCLPWLGLADVYPPRSNASALLCSVE